jgi:hypothetical protein
MKYTALLVSAFIALTTQSALAAEGGMGLYPLGLVSPQAGMLPSPGNYLSYNFYWYTGDASVDATLTKPVPFPGSPLEVTADGKIKANVDIYAHLFTITHVFDDKIWGGGRPALAVNLAYADANLDVRGNGTISLTNPKDPSTPVIVSSSGEINGKDNGIGDSVLTGMVGWQNGYCHTVALFNVYVPTGNYDEEELVNVGKNHWGFEPMINYTYLNEKNGFEFSAATGITFNTENHATDYRTGDEFHLDLSVMQHFSPLFYLGLAGYTYDQLSGDSGDGAPSAFKGRVSAAGPIVGGIIPIDKYQLIINGRYYFETDAHNRFRGETFFFTAVMNFA